MPALAVSGQRGEAQALTPKRPEGRESWATMGSNEIKNSIEACAWIVAAAAPFPDLGVTPVAADQFFFRSISGFVDRIDVLTPALGTDWIDATEVVLGLYLDRNYSRRATTIFTKNINTVGVEPTTGDPSPISMDLSPNVLALTEAAYNDLISTGTFPTADDLDPFSRLLVTLDVTDFQDLGFGTEFGIELLSMPQNEDGNTNVQFPVAAP